MPVYGYYYFRTSLPFYLRRPVGLVTTDGDELTSNYLVWREQETRRGPSPPAVGGEGTRTWEDLDPLPLDERRLLDIREFVELARSSPLPRLILVRNSHVGNLTHELDHLQPLWNSRDYSVWQVGRQDQGVRSQESGDGSQDSGFRIQESGVRRQESGDRSQESEVKSQESE